MKTCSNSREAVKCERPECCYTPDALTTSGIGVPSMAKIQSIIECPSFPVVEGVEFRHALRFLGYIVGSDGSVWSCIHRYNKIGHSRYWRTLSQVTNRYGYKAVNLLDLGSGKMCRKLVHALICEAFNGPRPEGLDCCHNDGSRDNNKPENLRWDTVRGNMADCLRMGTYNHDRRWRFGERSPQAKLTNRQVVEIKNLAGTMMQKDIATLYGVGQACISDILRGRKRKQG
jgi:hypothetical protein